MSKKTVYNIRVKGEIKQVHYYESAILTFEEIEKNMASQGITILNSYQVQKKPGVKKIK